MEIAAELGTELALSGLHCVINKLASYFGGDVTPAEIKYLSDFVRYKIVALTREASSDDLLQSMPLLKELQAAALELEDLLDEYEYKKIEKQVSPSSSNFIKKIIPRTMLPKSSLRKKFEKLLEFVEQVEKIHPFIKSRTDHTTQPPANTITPTTSTLLSPYFGRENQCESIIHFLLDESHADSSSRTNIVPVIAIIGMGGFGKSHTAQRICNDDRIKNHFDANMWVHVTRDFNVERLTRKIIESATSKQCPNFENFDTLQKNLIESLSKDSKRKMFLLVLDDVWCEDKMKWDLLLGPLNLAPRNGSKIIITTRTENIAYNLNATKFCLGDLKTEECWSVIKHYAFGNSEEIINDQELINVGNQIISKVKHSPLALKVVGSSLSNKRSINEWEKILKHKDVLKETMDLLLFSFQCLPPHLQRCFAYCSLFPKGYKFEFDVSSKKPHLISLWIAQGFIENTNELTLEEAGMKYIEELLSYSFFEKKYCVFVIHDLLHDLAEKVSKKQCHRIDYCSSQHIPTTCIHLCISGKFAISDIFELRNLRSLIILDLDYYSYTNIFECEKSIFQNITKLRALYVDPYEQLEVLSDPRIGNLKHLRYLHVRYDRMLHVSLTRLYHLQFFILITNQVDGHKYLQADIVPQGFGNLINLRTLKFYEHYGIDELDYLYNNSKMINIEKLTSLQNLKKLTVVGSNGIMFLRNSRPCESLTILNLENVKCKEEAEESMLYKKKYLIKLVFEWSRTPSSIDTCEEVLEGLEPHENLKKLEIRGYEGVRFPNWMVKENWLPCLRTLTLLSCKSLKIVQILPSRLQKLAVGNCCELMQLPPLSKTLLTLKLYNCPKLMSPSMSKFDLSFLTILKKLGLGGFPNLQSLPNLSPTVSELRIEDCPKLTSLGNCTSLGNLLIYKCPMLMREEPSLMEGVVQGDMANRFPRSRANRFPLLCSVTSLFLTECAALPNLEKLSSLVSLVIEDCPDVESLPNLPDSLQFIEIYECPKLKEKYEEGGPLRHTISHIPIITID